MRSPIRGKWRDEPRDLLLVEPNPEDARLFRESLDDTGSEDAVHVVTTGEEALDFMHRRGAHGDAPHPDIVLLDLQLPDTSGHEVLDTLKGRSELGPVPVIVLTRSEAEEDIVRSYELHANAYVQEPEEPEGFADLAHTFQRFWLSHVKLPPTET